MLRSGKMPKKTRRSQKKVRKAARKKTRILEQSAPTKKKPLPSTEKKKTITRKRTLSSKTTSKVKTVSATKRRKKAVAVQVFPEPLGSRVFRQLRTVLSALFRELVYPFYYLFRYHFFATLFALLLTGLILGGAYLTYDTAFKDLPPVTQMRQRKQPLTTKILDRNGKLLYSIYKDQNRTLVPLSKVPPSMIQATIAIEDREFYTHHGLSFKGIARAIKVNSEGERIQGGSTITQQLVKMTLLTPEKTLKRKIREAILSFLVERTYTKEEILEMYLNETPYGGSTYGVEEAAQRYFGKSAQRLNLAESAFLAGLPQSPSLYSPFGSSPELAYARQREVLRRMVEDEYITQQQADAAREHTLSFRANVTDIQAPHFVMYVRELLAQQYGEELVNQGGLEVRTTLDFDLQTETEKILTEEMNLLSRLRISNGAVLVTDPQTGEVLTMVGSKDYFDFEHDGQVNVTMRPRQPGSSIKPVTYAAAFERGLSPTSMIRDEAITYNIQGSPPYSPKNYDGRFHGNVSVREALASSYNIPAVKTLDGVGITNVIDLAETLGITTWKDRTRFGLSLTLGGGEVLMTDMAKVYGTFANNGVTTDLSPILEIKTAKGDVLYHNNCALDNNDCPSRKTLSTKTAYQITDILTDNVARTPAFGPNSVLHIPEQQVAVKTGTTNNLRDNWTIGYTTDRVVAVWVGNNDNTPMSYVASGITGASPIWNKVIRLTLSDEAPHQFPLPEGLVRVKVCVQTQTLPCNGCPTVRDELFAVGSEPQTACNPNQFSSPIVQPTAPTRPQATYRPQPQAPRVTTPRQTTAPQTPSRPLQNTIPLR